MESQVNITVTAPVKAGQIIQNTVVSIQYRDIIYGFFIVYLLSLLYTALSRLYLHPLASIPGPRLAAVSSLYGFFYNFIRDGTYSKQFLDMHRKYRSPVIRVEPNRVHVNDVDFYETVFRAGSHYYKEPKFYTLLGADGALASITAPVEHRKQRTYLGSLFSSQSTSSLKPRLLQTLEATADHLKTSSAKGLPVDIQNIYAAMTGDVICDHLFGSTYPFILAGDKGHPLLNEMENLGSITWLMMEFPFVKTILKALPNSMLERISPQISQFRRFCDQRLQEAEHTKISGSVTGRKSYFDLYVAMDSQRDSLQDLAHVFDGAFNFMTAGIHTTAYTLSCVTFNILHSPLVLSKVQAELQEAKPFVKNDAQTEIRDLPYLEAVIKETMRLSDPVPGLLPRVVPSEGVQVGSFFLPGGTSVSISHPAVHLNPEIFPEPHKFRPERWLESEGKLDKWNVAFSKGSRRCIGMNMAYMEMTIILSYIFSRFELELPGDAQSGIEWADHIVSHATKHLTVKVSKDRWE